MVLPSYRGDSRAVFVVGPVIAGREMGGRTPETCWAVNKRQDNKLENCCIWLVIYLILPCSLLQNKWQCVIYKMTFLTVTHMSYTWTSTLKGNINLSFLGNCWVRIRNKETPVDWGMDCVSLKRGFFYINPLNAELNPICHLLALLEVHFLHVSRIRVKSLTLRLLMSYIWSTYSWCF